MSATTQLPLMTAEEFLAWSDTQPGRYELDAGHVVAMAPERLGHVRMKTRVAQGLSAAISAAGLTCEALIDGVGVQVDPGTIYIPDVMVHCGDPLSDDVSVIEDPIIVVEVVSPSTGGVDTGVKMQGYLRLPSVRHYLLVYTARPIIMHSSKDGAGTITTRILPHAACADGLLLDPPGLVLRLT